MRVSSASAAAVAGLLLASAAPATGQAAGSVEIGVYGQVTRVQPEQARFETTTPLSLGLRGRVNLNRLVGVEMEASTGMVDGAGDPPRRRYNQLVARGTYTVRLSDFSGLLLGAGVARSDYEITYNFGASGLVGIRTVISGRYALRSDLTVNYLPTSGAREFGMRTGVQRVIGPFDGPTTRDRARGNRTVQEPGSIEAGVFAQQWQLHPVWNLENGRAAGVRVGTFLTSRSALEVEATYGRQGVRNDGQRSSTGFLMRGADSYRVTTFAMRYAHNLPIGSRYAVLAGIESALADIRSGRTGAVPQHLRDSHYPGAKRLAHGSAGGYRYPHDFPGRVVAQQYAPDPVVGREYYSPSGLGVERVASQRLAGLREVLRGDRGVVAEDAADGFRPRCKPAPPTPDELERHSDDKKGTSPC